MHASWEFAKRASEGDKLNLLRTQPATEVERDCIRLCERGIQVCNTSDYVPIALTEAAKIASQGKYRGFGIDAGELATETLESFGRKRALDNYAPHLTPDNTEEAKKIFREFARTIAQRTFSDRCKELNRNNLVSEFVQEAPMPQLAPEVDDERIRAALNSITEGMKKELKNELPVLDYLRQGYKPAQIAKMLDISVATVHKRKSRAIFKIKQAALQRVKEADLIPANWVIVRDVRANFQSRKEAALAQAKEQGNTNLGEVKVEMLDLAIETVAKEHNLSVEEVKKTINFACRQVYPRLNQDDMTEF
jgi:DNA-directed RNA polymerase specialized sigma24 family protein